MHAGVLILITLRVACTHRPHSMPHTAPLTTPLHGPPMQLPNGSIEELQVSPQGEIKATYPLNPSHMGINIFLTPALRGGALNTIRLNRLVLSGPLMLVVQEDIKPEPPKVFAGALR